MKIGPEKRLEDVKKRPFLLKNVLFVLEKGA